MGKSPATQSKPDSAQLLEAFSLFNETSRELTEAYGTLQAEVARLGAELASANARLRAELRAREALNQRLSLLLELLPGAVLVVDDAGAILQMNPEASRLLGSDKVGSVWHGLEDLRLGESGEEWLLQQPGKPIRRLAVAINALPDEGGQIVLLQDVTATRARQAAAQQRERLAAMGETMAGLAHQLRTPLATALLALEQMSWERGPEHIHKQRQRALQRLRALETTIDKMLLFLRSGEVEGGRIGVADILDGLRENFAELYRQKNVDLRLPTLSADLFLTGSREAWISILGNLLENALQFSPEGGTVRVDVAGVAGILHWTVCDEGPGVPTAERGRIFAPFYTRRRGGTGLGLSIVRNFVESMGGSIQVMDTAQGACFRIQVPVWTQPEPILRSSTAQEPR
ncbi:MULTISPECIES: sensor histidine kinase [Acidithiobacillus]|uniref:histidine kinase n=3 Tax=Acidithiobacillus caldus TaxID=33059 RepID=F9ZN87_ACICS|nr:MULTISPECIES: HAMP domain-containing sensor histidine kinase [Acidithiobacillus]AEK58130.1 Flagellar sensor histidine kinase fleS [Acidithiobacillus caldus SM-1]AIA55118.1 Flagellar sensor histidine kinase FleS [Acidithiobacillus caldus ATCC 51756]AUW32771.1 HAMP domain-containing histidine kinase [Acidithiobacillus caldus]MBU2730262.1 HAMP domain-containing histidine kinase [Acidithiobacillus caldus]MBU2734335.1 HAMP domain-containing histidine kinase [Acidithiobacillus caldus ATCC 51756]